MIFDFSSRTNALDMVQVPVPRTKQKALLLASPCFQTAPCSGCSLFFLMVGQVLISTVAYSPLGEAGGRLLLKVAFSGGGGEGNLSLEKQGCPISAQA